MPDDAPAEIFHLAQLINQLWGLRAEHRFAESPSQSPGRLLRLPTALPGGFQIDGRIPADAPCAVILADPSDRTLGNSFDPQYEIIAAPYEFLWGPALGGRIGMDESGSTRPGTR